MPGKHGGFFRRLKNKERKSAGKTKRGSHGLKKADRIVKANAMVDVYAAQRQLRELDAISESSDDARSDDSGSANPLARLRASLGVRPLPALADDPDDDVVAALASTSSSADFSGGTVTDGDQSDVNSGDDDEEPDDVAVCAVCGLDVGEIDGFACVQCAKCFCAECFETTHASLKHKAVPLNALDDDDAAPSASESDDGVADDSDSDSDAAVEPYDAAEPTEAEQDALRKAFLPVFKYDCATATAAAKQIAGPNDPWLTKYVADGVDSECTAPMAPLQVGSRIDAVGAVDATHSAGASFKRFLAKPFSTTARPAFVTEFVWARWCDAKRRSDRPVLSSEAWAYLCALSTYADVQVNNRTWETEPHFMDAAVLHIINHWAKAAALMSANDAILRRAADPDDVEARDRGFGRTRTLIFLPMRNIALRYMQLICDVLGVSDRMKPKFATLTQDFSEMEENVDPLFRRRPQDYQHQFGGNINDTFCFGAAFAPTGVSVYTHVLNSDIIIASPLGLRKRVAKDADVLVSLSSIELALVDQASAQLMQNWDHVTNALTLVNERPRDTTEGLLDLRRVYGWALGGHARQHRQTIVCTAIKHAAVNKLCRETKNASGRIKFDTADHTGVLPKIAVAVRQHFVRFAATTPKHVDDARFAFFTEQLFPTKIMPLVDRNTRVIVYIPSYFDFLRLRKFFDDQIRANVTELTEYSTEKEQRKALGQFSALERNVLLVTERFYFFKRYFVKHAEALVYYSPPLFPTFYSDLVNRLSASSPNAAVLCSYCKYDAIELERIVGTTRVRMITTKPNDAYMFVATEVARRS